MYEPNDALCATPKPTIGAIVIFRPGHADAVINQNGGANSLHPAIITRALTDTTVNLHVFVDGACSVSRCGVPQLVQPFEESDGSEGWYWLSAINMGSK
jgi:hypothetical protein